MRHLRALRGHGLRTIRSCRRYLSHSHERAGRTIPYRLYHLTAEGLPTWFGYYDKTPFSGDDNKILAMAMTYRKDWSKRAASFPVKVGWFDWSSVVSGRAEFHQFGETATWSWQQGCMLQWFPKDLDRLVLYNRLVEGKYGCVIQCVFTRDVVKSYDLPIYAIDPAGRWGVTLNFSRLERLRPGYGYANLPDETAAEACPDGDGIWQVDLETGSHELLLSLRQVADFRPLPSMAGVPHYINHLLFSPNGKRIVFLHLWIPEGGRRNRLMLYDFADGSLHVLDDAAMASHFNWLADDRLICFRYPHEGSRGYYVYTVSSDHAVQCTPMHTMPSEDGHPSLSPCGERLVTDAYPDRLGDQALYVYSVRQKVLGEVGRFFSPFRYQGPQRCDLHPRWDRAAGRVCFDSALRRKRVIVVLDLDRAECDNA
ncbi:MAG: hypothetical protein KBE65_08530 [Phycisphaerae bacterium]|nr:hypothetical protein [Phycisphaerae bacterium]